MKVRKIENLIGFALDVNVDDFEKVKKYKPEALRLFDEEENCVFAVEGVKGNYCGSCMGEVNDFSAVFIEVGEKLLIWMAVPCNHLEDTQEFVLEEYGMSIAKIKQVEEQVAKAVEAANAEVEAIKDVIGEVSL